MSQMKRRLFYCAGAVVLLAGCVAENSPEQAATSPEQAATSPEQGAKSPVQYDASRVAGGFDQVRKLPPGGPVPRTADGHPDLAGRYYPNHAGRMLQGGYQIDASITRQFDPTVTPQEPAVFTPEGEKIQEPTVPVCDEINRVVRARAGILRACYQRELARDPASPATSPWRSTSRPMDWSRRSARPADRSPRATSARARRRRPCACASRRRAARRSPSRSRLPRSNRNARPRPASR